VAASLKRVWPEHNWLGIPGIWRKLEAASRLHPVFQRLLEQSFGGRSVDACIDRERAAGKTRTRDDNDDAARVMR